MFFLSADVELVVLSPDSPRDMTPYADQLVARAYASGSFLFADADLKIDLPQARFVLDRERIADLGMSVADVSRQLSVLLSADYVNRFDFGGKAYPVIPLIEDQGRPDPQALLDQKLRTPAGDLVPVAAIAALEQQAAPRLLGRFQRKSSFRFYGGLIRGTTKEQGLAALETAAREILPVGYTIDYAGESRQLRKHGNTLMGVLGIALVFVHLVLAVQFNIFRDPLVVLLGSVPLALSGALLFAFLGWTSINIYSQVGFITLVGLIAKNGILIVEFANRRLEEGMAREAAIRDAACTRPRPVLMTTFATMFGHFPLVLVSGAGAECALPRRRRREQPTCAPHDARTPRRGKKESHRLTSPITPSRDSRSTQPDVAGSIPSSAARIVVPSRAVKAVRPMPRRRKRSARTGEIRPSRSWSFARS